MIYQPQTRYPNGVDPQVRRMSVICDVCGKPRNKGKHDQCSKSRQAAGFKFVGAKAADDKATCVQCHRAFAYGSMMGNVCRDCYSDTLYQALCGEDAQ